MQNLENLKVAGCKHVKLCWDGLSPALKCGSGCLPALDGVPVHMTLHCLDFGGQALQKPW